MKNNMDLLKLPIVLLPASVSIYIVIIYFLDMKSQKLERKDLVKQAVVMSLILAGVIFLYQETSDEAIFTNQAPF